VQVAAVVFDRMTPLDIVGPVEVLSRVPGVEIVVVAPSRRPVRDPRTHWVIVPEAELEEVASPDVLLVPGGPGVEDLIRDERVIDWVRSRHESTTWTASVCTGALVLAAAGLLTGRLATTHWQSRGELAAYGVDVALQRVVRDGKMITSAGVSAGIDLALVLAAAIAGEDVARTIGHTIEYESPIRNALDPMWSSAVCR
jgi:transcriptional regulator GlxA family with amidase domain